MSAPRNWRRELYIAKYGSEAAADARLAEEARQDAIRAARLRDEREQAERTAAAQPVPATSPDPDTAAEALFDPVNIKRLGTLFPAGGWWPEWTSRAQRWPDLLAARAGRGKYNPYRAALWWLRTQNPDGWEHVRRVLPTALRTRNPESEAILATALARHCPTSVPRNGF